MPANKLLVPFLLVVIAALAVWTLWGGRNANGFSGKPRDAADKGGYQALLDAQSRQDARLVRLEAIMGKLVGRSNASSSDGAALQSDASGEKVDGDRMTPAEEQAQVQERLRHVDAAFAAEPVSRKWSARNEKLIDSAFSMDSLAAKGAPKPRLYDAQCRSKTCRIEMVYANEAAAEEGQLFLLSDIGGTLGQSRPFQRILPDGSVQLIMYSSAMPPATRPGPQGH